ncbi:hypothetical protein PISL3812_00005 [Talaromyces islandicus]|uniref:Myb-like domain-containing protein n=1 Tax=Talaromyces islandicus TaxID=28573 RepID=A0A0U1LKM3_TALIS|nr:hypothetical protein PISL3812_00005 [Talaromyces islandicus]
MENSEESAVNCGNLSYSRLNDGYPSSPIASLAPTTNEVCTQPPNTDLAPLQNQDHENPEIRTDNTDPIPPTRPMTPSVSSEELVPKSVSTDLHPHDSIPHVPASSSIPTRGGKAERHENHHESVVLDSQDVEYSVQSIPHNGEARQQGTSTISVQDIICHPDEPATVQGNEPANVSNLPSIAVVMPVSSCSPVTSSKRTLSSNQCDLVPEPLLLEDDNDSPLSDDEDDADYIDDEDIPDADQRPPASKRRKISPGARSLPISRETRSSKKLCRSEPVQQDLGQAVKNHQPSPLPSEDVYCFTGLLSYLSRMPIEDRLQFVSWFCEGALTQIMPDPNLALSPNPASTAKRSRKSGRSSSKPRENKPWKPEEKALLRQLKKEEHLSWSAIEERFAEKFPKRKIGAIKLHWYTKLKDEPQV